ncbi:serine hydrolase domain-containing protein [Bacillus sp. PS06]|uniref:serine hydrolase domain-containing protein n=1 Tax=Bacillus sp. PS06 TaxID=2764176 RepID=UPI00177AE529|nr:serine hydrolase domain-containing protein [Bacillus sp. PS06]MBD8069821.1 beta-lactamase family protein [Bacillus sp. PS06]
MEGLDKLRPLLRSFVEKGPAGCTLSVTHQGKTVFEDYVGVADVESEKAIDQDTIYRIYSMSKVVTCTAALMLYERGLFLLDDPLEEYLPEFKNLTYFDKNENGEVVKAPTTRSIQIRDLFTMTSGLSYGGDGDEPAREVKRTLTALREEQGGKITVRELSKALAAIPLAFDPGSRWRYGLSHDVLGALIEVISGKRFGEYLEEEIFTPLGMEDTFFRIPEEKKHRLCSLYNRSENGELTKNTVMDEDYQEEATFESGGAGLLSTLGDFSRFTHMLANGGELDGARILGRKTVEFMATNQLTPEQHADYTWSYLKGYGYGLGVRTMMNPALNGSNSSIGEFGWCGMAGTWMLVDPKEKISAVYMQQMLPNFEEIHQPRLRNVIYGALN